VQAADRRGARTIKREERREKKRVTRKNDGTRLGEGERERERERERGKEGKREGEGEREREREDGGREKERSCVVPESQSRSCQVI